jgi:Sec-independent protein translocase protein TatA
LYTASREKGFLSIVEIVLLLVVALIVIPPERLPEVMQTVGKILRELRLASNTILRELSTAAEETSGVDHQIEDNPITTHASSRNDPAPVAEPSGGQRPFQS